MEKTVQKGRFADRGVARLAGRDYVVAGIFGVLLFAVFMAVEMVFSLNAGLVWFSHAVGAVPAGIVWMYVLARVPKRGAVAVMCALVAMLGLILGMFWTGVVGIAAGGAAAELILGTPRKRTTLRRVAAYAAFVTCFWAGQVSLVYLSGQAYVDMCVAAGMTVEYGREMVSNMHGPLALAALGATMIGSLLGGLFGTRVFKKHFARMGA